MQNIIYGKEIETQTSGPRKILASELRKTLESHQDWLNNIPGGVQADLSNCTISGSLLKGRNLEKAIMTNCVITGRVENTTFANAIMDGLNDAIRGDRNSAPTMFINCNMNNVSAKNSYMHGMVIKASMENIDLSGSDLSFITARGNNMKGANLEGVNLSGADVSVSDISEGSLRKSNMFGIKARETIFDGADLTNADVTRANMDKASFTLSDTKGTDFSTASTKKAKGLHISSEDKENIRNKDTENISNVDPGNINIEETNHITNEDLGSNISIKDTKNIINEDIEEDGRDDL